MKIAAKVYVGFGVVVTIVFAMSYFGRYGLSEMVEDFDQYDQGAVRTLGLSELDSLAKRLDESVQMYIFNGYVGMIEKARQYGRELTFRIDALVAGETDAQSRDYLLKMREHLATYMENFEMAINERRIRSRYVETQLRDGFDSLLEQLKTLDNGQSHQEAQVALYEMHRSMTEYFRYPDSGTVDRAKGFVTSVRQSFAGSSGEETAAFLDHLGHFEAEFLRAVQATRGYMSLVNVVMAGQSAEFSYNVEALKASGFESLNALRVDTSNAANARQATMLWLTILAIIGAGTASVIVSRSTVEPIGRITEVLRRIADGDKEASFDGSARNDELGTMADAAEVFRKRNLETERLLAESERMREELDAKTSLLERANEEMESFVYTVSHDLKSPIVTSQGFIGMMRELKDMGEVDEAFSKLERLEKANSRMVELIRDLLDLSRIGKVDSEPEWVSSQEIVDELLESLGPQMEENKVDCRVLGELPQVYMNRIRLTQVLDNLIGNALKYGRFPDKQGGKIEIGAVETESGPEMFIRDYGQGIDPSQHEKIFGLFSRLDVSKPGSGIGLSIVKKSMRSFGGDAWVESRRGEGATFRLRFTNSA